MGERELIALGVVLFLGVAHLLPPKLTFIALQPRSWLLSSAGGISLAYVFVHLLPSVAEAQERVSDSASGVLAGFERHAYVMALVGLVVFYGLESAAKKMTPTSDQPSGAGDERTMSAAFWSSVVSFVIYNAIIGYLSVQRAEREGPGALALFAIAIGFHFLVSDLGLRSHFARRYDAVGRPILVGAVLLGWVVGVTTDISEAGVGLAVAFLAGGIFLNVLKEEVPEERESRFLPLAAAAFGYSALLLAV